jgi:hypothetical protein
MNWAILAAIAQQSYVTASHFHLKKVILIPNPHSLGHLKKFNDEEDVSSLMRPILLSYEDRVMLGDAKLRKRLSQLCKSKR